jgi:hypothetical protein
VPRVKAALRSVPCETAQAIAKEALGMSSAKDIKALLAEQVEPLLPDFLIVNRGHA